MKRSSRWIVGIVLAAAILYFGASWIYSQRLTRARPSAVGTPPREFPYPIESITLKTRDEQTIQGWLVPASDPKKAIVLLHGWGGNRKQMIRRAQFFREQGYRACSTMRARQSTAIITFGYRERV